MEYPRLPRGTGTPDVLPAQAQTLLRRARHLVDGTPSDVEAWRGATPFSLLRRGMRNTVLRARVATGAGAEQSLVLKLAGADADLADADLRHMLALTGTNVVPDVVTELGEARGYAMVDAGDETLARLLEAGTPGDVLQAVGRMAWAYARLHVEGRAFVARTEAMREAVLTRELCDWMDGVPRALEWLQLPAHDPRVRRAISRVAGAWYAGREALTLTHGDPAPSNVLFLADGQARLIDFEYGAARPPAYDVTAWDILCPLPGEVVTRLRDEYAQARGHLGWPLQAETATYEAVLAYRALAMLAWLPRDARERDRPWVESWSARQAVLSTLDRLALRCAGDSELQRLAEAARDASAFWRRQWPEVGDVLPPWPAFRAAIA